MKALGIFLIVAPFVLIVSMTIYTLGWKEALCIWVFAIVITASIVIGVLLTIDE